MKFQQNLSENNKKLPNILRNHKILFHFLYNQMYLISDRGYENAGVRLLIEKETGIIWVSMKNVQDGSGVQKISDLVLKEIYGIYN